MLTSIPSTFISFTHLEFNQLINSGQWKSLLMGSSFKSRKITGFLMTWKFHSAKVTAIRLRDTQNKSLILKVFWDKSDWTIENKY